MVNTYQHISFAQLVYFSYVCGEALLATNTYRSNAAIFSALQKLTSGPPCVLEKYDLGFLGALRTDSVSISPPFPSWLCLQVKRHHLTLWHILGSTRLPERSYGRTMVGRSGSQKKSHHWFTDSVAGHISLDRPSLLP